MDRVEEKQTVTNDIANTSANGDTASNDSAVGMLYNDHPASQNPATNDPNIQSPKDKIIDEASNIPAGIAVNKRTGKKASRKKVP